MRLRVYAEHPWSSRGRTFEQLYAVATDAIPGDFELGPSLKVIRDTDIVDRLAQRVRAAPQPPPAVAAAPPELRIVEASYGADGHEAWDVTDKLREYVTDGVLDIGVGNHMFNAGRGAEDPTPGVVKALTIAYEVDGNAHTKTFAENTRAHLP